MSVGGSLQKSRNAAVSVGMVAAEGGGVRGDEWDCPPPPQRRRVASQTQQPQQGEVRDSIDSI